MRIDIDHEMLRYRRTKIVATLGPSSRDSETIAELVRAGVNVFRLNFSHGSHEEHCETYRRLRAATAESVPATAVLADLSGPKIRVGSFAGGSIELRRGDEVTVTTRAVEGRPGLIPSQYAALADDVEPGDRILLDDGNLELRAEGVRGSEIACRVITGGVLKSRKGMNLPGVMVSAPALTDKDRRDAELALELGVDFLALSFVRRGEDVHELRELVANSGSRAAIIAKIEKPEALEDIDAIVDAADGLMVARGDLGVELPPQTVPMAQDQLIDLARARAKPVIVATQMLESMMWNPRPTRAEVSDVATAVRNGADAVMLSGETAAGAYPVESVRTMVALALEAEAALGEYGHLQQFAASPSNVVTEAVAQASITMARHLEARAIVALTETGLTARLISKYRPGCAILAVTTSARVTRRLAMNWGVLALHYTGGGDDDLKIRFATTRARELGYADAGDLVIVTAGSSAQAGSTDLIRVLRV